MMITGYAAKQPRADLEQYQYDPGQLNDDEVHVDIDYCGICHSDVHLIDDDWGVTEYPFIPGHEIVGTVTKTGTNVSHLNKGTRVAIGWQANSCGTCTWCRKGEENLCPDQQPTAIHRNGGFADAIRVQARFAFPLPEALDSEEAAPLLCGGITTYTPLREVNAHQSVGVVGIGGLGHFALQFARAKGCNVTAFSTSPEKEEKAKQLGADTFVDAKDAEAIRDQQLDFILSTAPATLDYDAYLDALRPHGRFCNVGAVPEKMEIDARKLLSGCKGVTGSNTGGTVTIPEMLEFAAQHDIGAITESYDIEDVNEAIEHVRAGNAEYRVVLNI